MTLPCATATEMTHSSPQLHVTSMAASRQPYTFVDRAGHPRRWRHPSCPSHPMPIVRLGSFPPRFAALRFHKALSSAQTVPSPSFPASSHDSLDAPVRPLRPRFLPLFECENGPGLVRPENGSRMSRDPPTTTSCFKSDPQPQRDPVSSRPPPVLPGCVASLGG